MTIPAGSAKAVCQNFFDMLSDCELVDANDFNEYYLEFIVGVCTETMETRQCLDCFWQVAVKDSAEDFLEYYNQFLGEYRELYERDVEPTLDLKPSLDEVGLKALQQPVARHILQQRYDSAKSYSDIPQF
jgi:hypothetical protein